MKTPISYYGGKQRLASRIVKAIPEHTLYCEPFIGGGAVFWAKKPSEVEVINDTNRSLINFYRCSQNRYVDLEAKIRISLHSRDLHRKARVIYDNPDMFEELDQAWAVWVLANQSFSSMLDATWGYDRSKNTMSAKLKRNREAFTEEYSIRLQNVQIECTDALRIILSRDSKDSFFYVDPPYYNSDCGHYDGYTKEDFELLLSRLSNCEGRFLLSSYDSPILADYVKKYGWSQHRIEQKLSAGMNKANRRTKVEVLTSNYGAAFY